MRVFIDTNILMGWIFPDDKCHRSAGKFLGTLPHGGKIEIVNQVLSDLNRMANTESRWLMRHFNDLLPLASIERAWGSGEHRQANQMIANTMRKVRIQSEDCHASIKEFVESEMMHALDSGQLRRFVTELSIGLPRLIEDRVSGCLGPEAIGTTNGLPAAERDIEISSAINQELACEKGSFGRERDEADRRILSGLVLECHRDAPISFYTFDRPFFEGYMEFWKKDRGSVFDPAKNLDFVLLDNENIDQAKRFHPASRNQECLQLQI